VTFISRVFAAEEKDRRGHDLKAGRETSYCHSFDA